MNEALTGGAGAGAGAEQAKNVENIDRLREADFNRMVAEENIDALNAYFNNPNNIRTWGLSSFNKDGNSLAFAIDDKTSFNATGSTPHSLCLLNLRGETKFLRFNDFVSLVKSNNKRESGGGIFNKVKEVAGKIFSKENVDKLNNWPEKAWENTKKRFDDKIGAIESKLGIAGLSEDELEGFLIDHVMGKATLEKGFNRDGEETTTLIPNGESTRIAKLTALLLNGKIGMSSRIFAEAAVFKKYGVDLREITEIKAHLLDREYRGDHEENGSKEAFVRAGKVVAKGIGNFITRRFAPVSSNLDAEGKRAVDPRRAEKKWLDNTQTFDKIVERLGKENGNSRLVNNQEALKIIAKFESFDWKDLMPVNAGDRSKLEQAAWIFSSIIPPEMVEAVRATSLVGIFSMDIGGRLAENLIANEKYMDNKFLVGLARFSAKPAVRSLVKALSDTSRGVGGGLMAAKGFYLLEDLLDMMGHDVDLTPSISMDDITKTQDMLTEMGNSASDKAESVGSSVAENFNEFKDNATIEFNRIAENVDKVAENFRMPEMPNIDLPDFEMPEIDFSKVGDLKIVQFAKEIYTQGKELLGDKSEELRKIVEGINFDELGKPIQATPEQVEAIKEFIKDAKNLPAEAQKLIAEQIEKMDLPEMPDFTIEFPEMPQFDFDLPSKAEIAKIIQELADRGKDLSDKGLDEIKQLAEQMKGLKGIDFVPPVLIEKGRDLLEDLQDAGDTISSDLKYIFNKVVSETAKYVAEVEMPQVDFDLPSKADIFKIVEGFGKQAQELYGIGVDELKQLAEEMKDYKAIDLVPPTLIERGRYLLEQIKDGGEAAYNDAYKILSKVVAETVKYASEVKMPEIDFSKVGDLDIVKFAKELVTQGGEYANNGLEKLNRIIEGINFDELGKPIQATPEQVEAIKEFIKDAKNLPAEAQKLIAEQIEKMDIPEMPSMPSMPDIDLSDIELPSIDVDLSKFKDMDVIKVALEIIEKFQNDPSAGIEKLKELIPEVNINLPPTPEFIAKAREAIEDYIKNGEDSLKKYIYDQLEKIQDSLDSSDETSRSLPDSPLGEGSDPGLTPEPDATPTPDSSPTPQPLDPQPMAPDFPNPEMPAPEIDGSLHEVAKTADREWMEIFREQSNAAHPSADMGNREMIARIANGQFDLQGDVIKLPSDEIMDNFSQTMEVAIKELGPVADMDTELISSMSPDKVAALAGYFGDADRLARAVLADDPSMMSESRIGQVNENINWRAVVDFLKDITK